LFNLTRGRRRSQWKEGEGDGGYGIYKIFIKIGLLKRYFSEEIFVWASSKCYYYSKNNLCPI
jgi:hypothetical protein